MMKPNWIAARVGLLALVVVSCGCRPGATLRIIPTSANVAMVFPLDGCEPIAQLHLLQPRLASRREADMRLSSEQATWAGDGDWERFLVEFPLPGASGGNPAYLLYLLVPAGEPEPPVGGKGLSAAQGCLIQTGATRTSQLIVVGGQVGISGSGQARDACRRVRLDLNCDDGSLMSGTIIARRDDWPIQLFETRRYPDQVHALLSP